MLNYQRVYRGDDGFWPPTSLVVSYELLYGHECRCTLGFPIINEQTKEEVRLDIMGTHRQYGIGCKCLMVT